MINKIKSLISHASFKKYFANTSWLMADKVLRLVVGLFVGVYVARYLGPDNYGLLQYSMSFVALFGAFAKLGLENIVVRNAVKEPDKQHELLGTAFALRIIGGIVLFLIVFIIIQFTEEDAYTKLLIMVIACGHLLQAVQVFEYYFRAHVMAKFVSYAYITGLLTASIVKLVLIWISAPLLPFALTFVGQWLVNGILLFILYEKNNKNVNRWQIKWNEVKELLNDSWPLILSGLVIMVYMKIDQVMIKKILSSNMVGQYAAAVKISEAWYFIPISIVNSFFPAIINAKKQNEFLFYDRLNKLFAIVIWLSIIIAVVITFLSDKIIYVLYGSEYKQASYVLSIHVWAGVFVSLGIAKGKFMIANGIQWLSSIYSIAGAIINVLINLYLIPIIGIKGAAIATIISQIIAAYILPYFHKLDKNSSYIFNRIILLRFNYKE